MRKGEREGGKDAMKRTNSDGDLRGLFSGLDLCPNSESQDDRGAGVQGRRTSQRRSLSESPPPLCYLKASLLDPAKQGSCDEEWKHESSGVRWVRKLRKGSNADNTSSR